RAARRAVRPAVPAPGAGRPGGRRGGRLPAVGETPPIRAPVARGSGTPAWRHAGDLPARRGAVHVIERVTMTLDPHRRDMHWWFVSRRRIIDRVVSTRFPCPG